MCHTSETAKLAPKNALDMHYLRWASGECEGGDAEGAVVDETDTDAATKLTAYFEAHARAAFTYLGDTTGDQRVDALINWMRRNGKTTCTARDVYRSRVAGASDASGAKELLVAAEEMGFGEILQNGRMTNFT
jgi:hypothetical protein